MPIYEYSCPKCGPFEVTQRISDKPLSRCPTCRSKVRKLISATAFLLKGGGWYADGYQKPAAKGSEGGDSAKPASDAPAAPGASDSSSSTSKSAKPAAKPAAKPSKPAKAAS
jgi:putative FmdB family regulatory protein